MSRLSIRARLALAFAAALVLVLVLAGGFVYLRVSDTLTTDLDDRLETQSSELTALARGGDPHDAAVLPGPADGEDGFSQILTPDGKVVASTLAPGSGPAIDSGTLAAAVGGQSETIERSVPGVDGEARIVVKRVDGPDGQRVAVAGVSTDDRAEALGGIAGAFAIGGPIAVLLASGLGYLLAARSLAPVEAITRRAGEITLARSGERLPLPRAEDEINRLATTLNAMLERIEESLERERVFVADASHELRTPLAVLRAELELAERPGRDPQEVRAALRSAAEETERLSRLADDLLLIARSDDGRLPIKPERADVEPVLRRVRDRFAARAGEEGREVTVDVDDGLAADLDPLRIEQALGNLVDNALSHGAGEVSISAAAAGDRLRMEVRDTGPGFPEGFGDRAFERFTRGDPGRTGGGAGLGLAIVRVIAEAHGGMATVAGPSAVRIEIPGLISVSSAVRRNRSTHPAPTKGTG
jgi:signal transduction histidine kinase